MSELKSKRELAQEYCDEHQCHLQMGCHALAYIVGFDKAIEMVTKRLWLADECNSAIGLKKITKENCFQDFCNLVVACLSIKKLGEGE